MLISAKVMASDVDGGLGRAWLTFNNLCIHFNSLSIKLYNLFTLINTMCMWGCMCVVGNFCKLTAELGNRCTILS